MSNHRTLLDKWRMLQSIVLDLAEYRSGRAQTGSTISVAARLLHHYNSRTGLCCPSLETLAKAVGISERQVGRCVDLLVKRKWLTKHQRRDDSILYGFNWERMTGGNAGEGRATDV